MQKGHLKMSKLHLPLLFIVILIQIIVLSCSEDSTSSNKEVLFNYPALPKPKTSVFHLPISIPLAEIEQLVNSKVGKVLLTKKNIDTDKVLIESLEVIRTGTLSLSTKNNKLYWVVPLKFKIKASPKQKILQLNFLQHLELNFGLTFNLESDVELLKNYHLQTHTTLKSYNWEDEPELNFGKLNFSLTKALAKQIEENKKVLIPKLDSLISEKVDLKNTVNKIWENLQTPKSINKQLNLIWFCMEPEQIHASQPIFSNNQIKIPLDLKTKTEVLYTDSIPLNNNINLPDLKFEKITDNAFDIKILAKIPYAVLNQNWNILIKTNTYKIQGQELVIENITFRGMGEELGIEVTTSGVTEATILFSGKPKIDKENWVLYVTNFDFEMSASDLLADGAAMIYGDEFKKIVSTLLYFPLKGKLMILPIVLEEALNKGEKAEKRTISIPEMDFNLNDPIVHKDTLFLELQAMGKASLNIESFQ